MKTEGLEVISGIKNGDIINTPKETGDPADQDPLDSANDTNLTDGPEPRAVSSLNIHQRINAVMAEVDYIKKDKKISMGSGGFSVTGHDAITGLIHPMLVKHGINVIPTFQEMTQEGNRTHLKMGFDWTNIDDPKDLVHQDWQGYGIDTSDKGPGKAASYIQRMATLKFLHIETGDKTLEEHDTQFKKDKVLTHSASVQKKLDNQDIPLPDGSQISDGSTIDASLQLMVRKAFSKRRIGTAEQKILLDDFMVDKIEEVLNSDYEKMIEAIANYSG